MKSKYNATRNITANQYLAEVMCERRAKMLQKDLPDKFWNSPGWKQFFVYQLQIANHLVNKYGKLRTLYGIVQNLSKDVWSLKHPAVKIAIEKVPDTIKSTELNIVNEKSTGRQTYIKTLIDKLDEL